MGVLKELKPSVFFLILLIFFFFLHYISQEKQTLHHKIFLRLLECFKISTWSHMPTGTIQLEQSFFSTISRQTAQPWEGLRFQKAILSTFQNGIPCTLGMRWLVFTLRASPDFKPTPKWFHWLKKTHIYQFRLSGTLKIYTSCHVLQSLDEVKLVLQLSVILSTSTRAFIMWSRP